MKRREYDRAWRSRKCERRSTPAHIILADDATLYACGWVGGWDVYARCRRIGDRRAAVPCDTPKPAECDTRAPAEMLGNSRNAQKGGA